jgi:hypothetical protein
MEHWQRQHSASPSHIRTLIKAWQSGHPQEITLPRIWNFRPPHSTMMVAVSVGSISSDECCG